MSKAIFFASVLIAGAIVFLAVAAFEVDWFAPSVALIVLAAIGWDRFMDPAPPLRDTAVEASERALTIDVDGAPGVIQANRIVINGAGPVKRKVAASSVASRRPRKPAPGKAVL